MATRTNPATRTAEPLQLWLQHTQGLRQKELVGLLRCLLKPQRWGKGEAENTLIELHKAVIRLGLVDTFSSELRFVRASLDAALAAHWRRMKSNGVKIETWWPAQQAVASLVVDSSDTQAVIACAGAWEKVAPQIARLTSRSHLGEAMWCHATVQLNTRGFQSEVDAVIKKHFQEKITMSELLACRKEIQGVSDKYRQGKFLKEKREILVPFVGTTLEFVVQDPSSEVELRVQAALRSQALGTRGGIPLLEHEQWCAPEYARDSVECTVDSCLLAENLAARKCLSEMLQKEHGACLEDLKRCLRKNYSMLVALDRSFKLECEFLWQKGDEMMSQAVDKHITGSLPSNSAKMTLAQSMGILENLHDNRLFQFAPREAQNRMEAVMEVLRNMAKGISPSSVPDQSSVFWKRVWASLPLYLRTSAPNSSGSSGSAGPAQELVGRKALTAELEAFTKRFAQKDHDVKLHELERLQPYKWLMAHDEAQTFATWVEKTLRSITDSASAVTRLGIAKGKDKEAARKGSSSSGNNTGDGSAGVMHFFR